MKRNIIFSLILAVILGMIPFGAKDAMAFNYAGYRWGGTWPKVVVDYSPVAVVAWRNVISGAMADWNNAWARFSFLGGSSNNKISVTWRNSPNLATATIYRQWWGGGNVSKVTVAINSYHAFYPGNSSGYDLATVIERT